MSFEDIEAMTVEQRRICLRKKWGIEINYSKSESAFPPPYPMCILQDEAPVGEIVCSGGNIIVKLPDIDEVDHGKLWESDALLIWENNETDSSPFYDYNAQKIHRLIFYYVGKWAELKSRHKGI